LLLHAIITPIQKLLENLKIINRPKFARLNESNQLIFGEMLQTLAKYSLMDQQKNKLNQAKTKSS
jgi:hypothetical protein